jgi:hypothetical protein
MRWVNERFRVSAAVYLTSSVFWVVMYRNEEFKRVFYVVANISEEIAV